MTTTYNSSASYNAPIDYAGVLGLAVWPLASDVRLGVTYGPTGIEYVGTMSTGGETVFAAMFAVQIDTPRLTLAQQAKREAGEADDRTPRQIDETGDDKDAVVLTRQAAMSVLTVPEWLTVTPQRETQVFVQRDVQRAVVRQNDVLEMN